MSLSMQERLIGWYAAALLVALGLCGLGLYTAVTRLELSQVDQDLQRAASTTAFSMHAEELEGLSLRDAAKDTGGELRIAGIAVAIYDDRGALLAAQWENLGPSAILGHGFREGISTIRVRAADWRGLVTRHQFKDGTYFVLSAFPLEEIGRHTALIRSAFLAIVPFTLALALGGGWLLARAALRPVLDAQRQFMADASHELRTPVSVIRSAADITLSRQNRTSEEYNEAMVVVGTQARRLTRLVEDLFLLARADVKQRPLTQARFYLDDVINECARAAEILSAAGGVRFDITSDHDVEVFGDEDLVRRMLMNLFDNAARHSPAAGIVTVTLTREIHDVRISVSDNGPGVPSESRERIFHRFVRLEGTAGGAGLGLPIARWIAEAHRGTLTIADSSAGSTFVVRLPIASPDRSV
jgi:signal transduction histidine kinase